MLLKLNNKLDSLREVGVPEAISHLLKFPDHYTDAKFVNIHTTHLLRYMRDLVQQRCMQDADEDGDEDGGENVFNSEIIVTECGFRTVSLFDDYAYRGDALADYCLYDYCAQVYKHRRLNGVLFECPHPQHERYSQFLRKDTTTVPTLLGKLLFLNPASPDTTNVDDYYCLIASLFFPWCSKRTPKSSDESWQQFVENNEH